jgi:hypothetical protein
MKLRDALSRLKDSECSHELERKIDIRKDGTGALHVLEHCASMGVLSVATFADLDANGCTTCLDAEVTGNWSNRVVKRSSHTWGAEVLDLLEAMVRVKEIRSEAGDGHGDGLVRWYHAYANLDAWVRSQRDGSGRRPSTGQCAQACFFEFHAEMTAWLKDPGTLARVLEELKDEIGLHGVQDETQVWLGVEEEVALDGVFGLAAAALRVECASGALVIEVPLWAAGAMAGAVLEQDGRAVLVSASSPQVLEVACALWDPLSSSELATLAGAVQAAEALA